MGYPIQYSPLHNTVWTAFATRRDHVRMCGRYVTPDEAAMERAYNLTARQWEAWMNEAYRPSYNVASSQRVPVLRVIRQVGGERRIDPMRWGLIPFFARGEPPKYSTINAMIEKLDVAPAWRGPWRRSQRCVMPAAGFYEGQVQPDGTKQPYYIQPAGDDEVFSIAALWDRSRTESGEEVLSCAIICRARSSRCQRMSCWRRFTTRSGACR
jgi:putative SOS response-associated peptidase YedK